MQSTEQNEYRREGRRFRDMTFRAGGKAGPMIMRLITTEAGTSSRQSPLG